MTDKELDRTLDMGPSDTEDNLILPNLSDKKPNATYNSYQAFLDDFSAWYAETFQTFVTGRSYSIELDWKPSVVHLTNFYRDSGTMSADF